MSSGKFGSADLSSNTDVLLYTAPESKVVTLSVRLCNRSTDAVRVRIAVGEGNAPANTDYIEHDTVLPPAGILENSGIVMSAKEKLWVRSSAAGVSARAHGFEEAV